MAMETISVRKRRGYLVTGGVGACLALGYLWMSFGLPFGQIDQPGAAVFPVIVGITLLLSSAAAIWEGFKIDARETVVFPAGANRIRLLALVGLLLGYFLLLPWLGHVLSSILFCMLLMRTLSTLGWPRIVAYSLAITASLYVVFVMLLKLPLPRGLLAY
jgi:putative tricarboxylic transport membrane protein